MQMHRRERAQRRAPVLTGSGGLTRTLLERIPFKLTRAQEKVWREISHDLKRGQPMHRLLQGDVGAGKTVVAALAALQDLGTPVDGVERLRAELARFTRFAAGLREAFPWPAKFAASLPDETIVCRCEAITAGELRRVVQATGACEANRAKAFSRVGMGRCQGRYCGHAGAEIIAAAASVPLSSVGRLRGQAPVKPLPVALVEEVSE